MSRAKNPAKTVRVLRRRKVLHIGIDLARAPWTATLVRALPANIENHASHADDTTASLLQLHRPQFPEVAGKVGPGAMNRMARTMKGYDLVITHGEAAFPAVMAHTLFGQGHKAPPLVHYHDGVDAVPDGRWSRFRHKLGLARTPRLIVPAPIAALSILKGWDVPASRIDILPPLFPLPPKAGPRPDAIPRLMKRAAERWIAVRAADALAMTGGILALLEGLDENWHFVAFGADHEIGALRQTFDATRQQHRLHSTARLHGPASVAGMFDLALMDARNGLVPPDMPALMAAGVAFAVIGPPGLGELLPEASRPFLVAPAEPGAIEHAVRALALDTEVRTAAGAANAAFAARHASAVPHLAALAGTLGLASLEDR